MIYLWVLAAAAAAAGLFWLAPLFTAKRSVLPILLINKIGIPFSNTRDKRHWLSINKLEKLLVRLQARGFVCVLPSDILHQPLPPKPVLLVFASGYETIYTEVFKLLEKWNAKAAVALAAERIGQYDAWQEAKTGPWQDLLTAAHIQQLHQSERIEFISSSIDGSSASDDNDEIAIWKLTENKTRLQHIYKLKTDTLYFPPPTPHRPAVLQQAKQHFSLRIGNQTGTNLLPLDLCRLQCIFPLNNQTNLLRLLWKMERY